MATSQCHFEEILSLKMISAIIPFCEISPHAHFPYINLSIDADIVSKFNLLYALCCCKVRCKLTVLVVKPKIVLVVNALYS